MLGIKTDEKKTDSAEDMRKYNLHVMAIPETHLTLEEDIDEIRLDKEEYIIYSVNKKDNHHHGIGLIIKKEHKPNFEKVSDRICKAKLKVFDTDVTIIGAYAPTHSNNEKDTTVRDNFYEQLEGAISRVPKKHFLIVAGDFNAQTGSGHKDFPDNVGRFGKGFMNSSGRRLLETCLQYDLVITNTLFQHKLSHRSTLSELLFQNKNIKKVNKELTVENSYIQNSIYLLELRLGEFCRENVEFYNIPESIPQIPYKTRSGFARVSYPCRTRAEPNQNPFKYPF
jgi:hypothetical protein